MDKNKITEKLKDVENEYLQAKVELDAINRKLELAYMYEEEVNNRLIYAKGETEKLRREFFEQSQVVQNEIQQMKNIFDIWTGKQL